MGAAWASLACKNPPAGRKSHRLIFGFREKTQAESAVVAGWTPKKCIFAATRFWKLRSFPAKAQKVSICCRFNLGCSLRKYKIHGDFSAYAALWDLKKLLAGGHRPGWE